MHFSLLFLLGFCSLGIFAAPSPRAFGTFSGVTIFTPPSNYNTPKVLYARTVLLDDGSILATWENYSPEPPLVYFPIYRSVDGGETWNEFSQVTDQVNSWGLRYQPFLYLLPQAVGNYPKGTILCAGNSIPTNLNSTRIDVYASADNGLTWEFVSHVASGGAAMPDNGVPAIWEPFLQVYNGQMVIFYSDQRDPNYGQKLVHQVSSDLLSWAAPVDDVTYPVYTARPGMTTMVQLPNNKWMMTYEYGGGPGFSSYQFPVYYRISDSPLTFNSAADYPVVAGSTHPTSSPYLVWTSAGGANGTIIVSSLSSTQIFVNKALGAVDKWTAVNTPAAQAYSRHLRVMANQEHLMIMGAGFLPPSTTNIVTVSVVDVS